MKVQLHLLKRSFSVQLLTFTFLLVSSALLAVTPSPATVHTRNGATLADISSGGSLFEVYYTPANSTPDGRLSMGTYGSTNYVSELTDTWLNIGPTGNTGATGLATTIGEFTTPAAVRYYRLRGQTQENYQIVILVQGYLSVSSLYKTTTSTILVEKWNGTDYEAFTPTVTVSELNGTHYRQNATLNTTDQFRVTFTASTTGTSNNDFLGFSLEVNGATTGTEPVKNLLFDGSTILNPDREFITVWSTTGKMMAGSYDDIRTESFPQGVYIVKTQKATLKIVTLP